MLTALGKVLRVIRMERGLLLKDMADKMGVKPSYISSIENGKRKPSKNFIDDVKRALCLTGEEFQQVRDAYSTTIEEVSINLADTSDGQRDLGLAFARKLNGLSSDDIKKMMLILNKREEN